ncbi:MAG TPA: glutamate racemase [Candidatus Bipolaricaulota bacterium]|nr:glutamate racemase [Candidatus Bipolaricaulota bacterium]
MIGVFDSGLGGLTVLRQLLKNLPQYDYLYLGDTARVPYGNRSAEAIYEFSKQACDYLFEQGCELIIVACNTSSGLALKRLQEDYLPVKNSETKRILGVIRPVAEFFAVKDYKRIGVIGTRGTIASNVYKKELEKLKSKAKIFQAATPLFVPLIEENWLNRPETMRILRTYLRPLKNKKIQSLILGCTHYPILIKQIRRVMGKQVDVPNPAKIVAESLKDYLKRHPEIETKLGKNKERKYLATDLTENFEKMAERFLGQKLKIEQVDLRST